MDDSFKELKAIIECIQSEYAKIANEWLQKEHIKKINLKKKYVSDIGFDNNIYNVINEYVAFINTISFDITRKIVGVSSLYIETRVKAQNSIEAKIEHYKTAAHSFGKIPIIKCLNDLYGARVTLSSPLNYSDIKKFIDDSFVNHYKCIDSSKGEYKATHIYFKNDNQTFPWELQIWNECDRENNLLSHQKYKQGYTSWEKENTERGIL